MPDRAPDMHFPPLDDAEAWKRQTAAADIGYRTVRTAVWLPDSEGSGYIYIERQPGSRAGARYSTFDYRQSLQRLHEIGDMGLRPLFEAAGLDVRLSHPQGEAGPEVLETSFPNAAQFCSNVDQAADQGLCYMRYATAPGDREFTAKELATSLAVGRMLIANPTAEQMKDPDLWYLFWHDLTIHAPAHLLLSRGAVQSVVRKAAKAVRRQDPDRMEGLTLRMEYGVHTYVIDDLHRYGKRRGLKGFDRFPRLGLNTTNRAMHRRLRSFREQMGTTA
jgi:hypothetical protein